MTRARIGQIAFIAISSVTVILAAGGVAFVRRPVGMAYVALWILWWVVMALGQRWGAPSAWDRSQWVIVPLGLAALVVLVIGVPWEYASLPGPIPRNGPVAWIGLTLFAGGIALQWAAMRTLRGLFTVRLSLQPGHHLVTSGPYRWVRHPGYLGYVISLTGIGLALSSIAGLTLAVSLVLFLVWRIHCEEEMLLAKFADEYRAYMQKTRWRLIPFVY